MAEEEEADEAAAGDWQDCPLGASARKAFRRHGVDPGKAAGKAAGKKQAGRDRAQQGDWALQALLGLLAGEAGRPTGDEDLGQRLAAMKPDDLARLADFLNKAQAARGGAGAGPLGGALHEAMASRGFSVHIAGDNNVVTLGADGRPSFQPRPGKEPYRRTEPYRRSSWGHNLGKVRNFLDGR